MKVISFKPEFILLIKDGTKTVTRRINTKLKIGDMVYFKGSRIGKKEGYLKILNINKERLHDVDKYGVDDREPKAEGFKNWMDFAMVWSELNSKHGTQWSDNPEIYRIEFRYLKDNQWNYHSLYFYIYWLYWV